MNHSLLQPQEIEVFYIIPALKKYLAVDMKARGLKQKRIAELLCIKDATVSQYLNDKRGSKIEFGEEVLKEIKISVSLIGDKISLLREMQRLLRVIKHNREICRIHRELSDIPKECTPELINCFGGEKDDTRNARICH
jgi:predicted transcriptional regulator